MKRNMSMRDAVSNARPEMAAECDRARWGNGPWTEWARYSYWGMALGVKNRLLGEGYNVCVYYDATHKDAGDFVVLYVPSQ